MDIRSVLKGKIKVSVKIKPVVDSLIDEVLEPALDKIVADSRNPFDNMLKASVYPALEKEMKEFAEKKIQELQAKIPESIRDFIELQ